MFKRGRQGASVDGQKGKKEEDMMDEEKLKGKMWYYIY